jgi:hypothetical protein
MNAISTKCLDIDANLVRLAAQEGALEQEIGQWLLIAMREGVHRELGMASFFEYVDRRMGYSARKTQEKIRVATKLEGLPKLRALVESGQRSWSAAREITRVAVPRTEDAWIAATEAKRVREIERMVAGRVSGDRPSDAADPALVRHRVVLDLSSEDCADLSDAVELARKAMGLHITTSQAIAAMARGFLGKAHDPDLPAYQIAVTICAGCGSTQRHAGGETFEVSDAIGACAKCDGEVAGLCEIEPGPVPPPEVIEAAPAELPPPVADTPVGPSHDDCGAECIERMLDAGGIRGVLRAVSNGLGLHYQTQTPKLRRAVFARSQHKCSVPGCNNHIFLQIHHLQGRGFEGCHAIERTAPLCWWHHKQHHDGYLAIEGTPSTGLVFRHANGTLYGRPLGSQAA